MSLTLAILAAPAGFAAAALLALVAPRLLRSRAQTARRTVAGVAAIGAALSSAAPTGIRFIDAIECAFIAAAAVVIGSRARPRELAVVAAAASVAAVGSSALPLTLVAVGMAAAVTFTTRRSPLVAAVVCALVAVALFHFESPRQHGATAITGAVVYLAMIASGYVRSTDAQRLLVRRVSSSIVAGALVLGFAALATAVAVRRPLLDAVDTSRAGLDAARAADTDTARSRFVEAAADFETARDRLEAPWAVLPRFVPVAAQHLVAAREAAASGRELALTGSEISFDADLSSLRVEGGAIDLQRVVDLREPAAVATRAVEHAEGRLRAADSPWLVGPFASQLDRELGRLTKTADETRSAQHVLEVLPALLGGDGPRRYFLAVQSPSEARGSGGIIGAFSEVRTNGGRIEFAEFGRDGDLNAAAARNDAALRASDDYAARYARFDPHRLWQNIPMSPHFPSVASVVAGMYPQSGGTTIDGVISVDPIALAALLRVTGPVTVAPWPEPISAANAERVLLFEQYAQLEGEERTDFLGDVARAVADRLVRGTLPPPAALVRALAPAVAGRHLLLWSAQPPEQRLFEEIDAAGGTAAEEDVEALAVVTNNAGGNKLDWFLRREYTYEHTGSGARIEVTLHNDAPSAGLPLFLIGSSRIPPDPPGVNRTYLSIHTPLLLRSASIDGKEILVESEGEEGLRVYSLFLTVAPSGGVTIDFDFTRSDEPSADRPLRVRRQPMVNDDAVRIVDGSDVRSFTLTQDALVSR